jgi:alpha,alpha-trehalase
MRFCRSTVAVLLASVLAVAGAQQEVSTSAVTLPSPGIECYIHDSWTALRRSMSECASLVDAKVKTAPVLYLPKDFPEPPEVAALPAHCVYPLQRFAKGRLRRELAGKRAVDDRAAAGILNGLDG